MYELRVPAVLATNYNMQFDTKAVYRLAGTQTN